MNLENIKIFIKDNFIFICIFVTLLVLSIFGITFTNYGYIAEKLGADTFTVIGTAKDIPGAQLEYQNVIPNFQATVLSNFQPINISSIFKENLIGGYSLPISDYSIFFKPDQWLFFILDPHIAYSFRLNLLIFFFIITIYFFFRAHNVDKSIAIISSLILYFSAFLQTWLTLFIGTFFYLFLSFLCLVNIKSNLRYLFLAYFFLCSCFFSFYPTFAILNSYLLLIFFYSWHLANNKDINYYFFKSCIYIVISILCVASVFYLYHMDFIDNFINTSYPGSRRSFGGGGIDISTFVNLLIPNISRSFYHSYISKIEAPEISFFGSFYTFYFLFFFNWKSIFLNKFNNGLFIFLLVINFFIFIWLFFDLPHIVSKITFFQFVTDRRLLAILSLVNFIFFIFLSKRQNFVYSDKRLLCFFVCYFILRFYFNSSILSIYLIFDFLLFFLILFQYKFVHNNNFYFYALIISLFSNFLFFGHYYPLAKTYNIFNPIQSKEFEVLENLSQDQDGNILGIGGELLSGKILNGLGFKSYTHSFVLPSVDVYKKIYNNLTDEEFNKIFYRSSISRLDDVPYPTASGLGLKLPYFSVDQKHNYVDIISGNIDNNLQEIIDNKGCYSFDKSTNIIKGWAYWSIESRDRKLFINSNTPNLTWEYRMIAGNYPGNIFNGFVAKAVNPDLDQDYSILDVYSFDSNENKYFILNNCD